MAIYILAGSSDRPTGSRLGCTFQKAGVNFVIRRRTVPVQKRTEKQSVVKNRFDHVQKIWPTLSAAQQQTFADEAPNYPRVDSLGNPYTLHPGALASSSNLNLVNSDLPAINSIPAPVVYPFWTITSGAVDLTAESAAFGVSTNPMPAGFVANFFMSHPYEQQEQRSTLPLLQVAQLLPGQDWTTLNFWSNYISIVGARSFPGTMYFQLTVVMFSTDTGQADTPIESIGVIFP